MLDDDGTNELDNPDEPGSAAPAHDDELFGERLDDLVAAVRWTTLVAIVAYLLLYALAVYLELELRGAYPGAAPSSLESNLLTLLTVAKVPILSLAATWAVLAVFRRRRRRRTAGGR